MASLSLVLRYIFLITFFLLLNSKETFPSRVARSTAKVAQIGADDYPSSGHNSPVHDLGFPGFPSFQEAVAAPPPPDLPLLRPSPPDLPLFPPPPFINTEEPTVRVPAWPSLPDFPPFPFVDRPSEPSDPESDELDNWMLSTPSNPQGFP